jgi:S1 RNA binding domain protein
MQSLIGEIYEGKVTGLTSFGAFVRMSNGESGIVHISEVAATYVKDITEFLSEGQEVKVKVLSINENNKISLSIKQTLPQPEKAHEAPKREPRQSNYQRNNSQRSFSQQPQKPQQSAAAPMSFEDMMAKFKQESDEKISVLKKSGDFKTGTRRGYNK